MALADELHPFENRLNITYHAPALKALGFGGEDVGGYFKDEPNEAIPDSPKEALATDTPRLEPSSEIKSIMVTGGNGFLGYWVLRTLGLLYPDCYKLVSFDSVGYGTFARNTESLKDLPNFNFFQGDITCQEDIDRCIVEHGVDTVIHLAAQSHTANSSKNIAGFINSNVQGTAMLLERASAGGVQRFIFMSSGQVYGDAESPLAGFSESSCLKPNNVYSGTKAAGEMLVTAFGRNMNMKTVIVRCCNIFGPHQFPEKVIPKFIMLLRRGRKVPLNGSEEHSRRYMYISDVVNALNIVLHRGRNGGVYNVCSQEEIKNRDLCTHLIRCVKLDCGPEIDVGAWIDSTPSKKPPDRGAAMDCRNLRWLGWKPVISMEEGLRRTADWYMRNGDDWWGDLDHIIPPRN